MFQFILFLIFKFELKIKNLNTLIIFRIKKYISTYVNVLLCLLRYNDSSRYYIILIRTLNYTKIYAKNYEFALELY